MTWPFKADDGNTIFIIASDFKDIALFKPKSFRGKDINDLDIVWYADINKLGLLRVSGNANRLFVRLKDNKISYHKI